MIAIITVITGACVIVVALAPDIRSHAILTIMAASGLRGTALIEMGVRMASPTTMTASHRDQDRERILQRVPLRPARRYDSDSVATTLFRVPLNLVWSALRIIHPDNRPIDPRTRQRIHAEALPTEFVSAHGNLPEI